MAWSGKLVGGLLGGMLGGPVGAGVGAALGHVVGDAARALELVRLDWQHHAFRTNGPGVVLTPIWQARKLVGRDILVRAQLGGVRQEHIVVPEDIDETCTVPSFFFAYADLDAGLKQHAHVWLHGPAGHGDDAEFPVQLPNTVRRLGGSGPARAVMALVASARAGNRAFTREDARFIRRTFCEGVELDDDGLVWLHDWLQELEAAEVDRMTPEKVAKRLQTHLDADAAARLAGWCWRGVRDAWPGPGQEAYVRALATELGTDPREPDNDPDERAAACAVLGVPLGASANDLKAARTRLIQRWHPDRAPSPAAVAEHNRRMAEVNAAYRLLTLPDT